MKRRPPAIRNIGIDLNRRAIDGFECDYPVELHHGCALRHPEAFPFQGREPVHCDPPYVRSTRRGPRRYRFNADAPVIDITVTPPGIEGLSEDDYEVIPERVHCRVATLDWRHVVIRYRYLKVRIHGTGALVSAPARESVFRNSAADVPFVAGMLIDRFRGWCGRTLEDPALTPKHPIRRAIAYATGRRATPEVFLGDPDVPPDTNLVENRLRNAKLGQRNRLFAWTEVGAEHTGIMNAMPATCRMQGVDPRVWLTDVLLRIDTHPASRVDGLTPRRWKELFADSPMTSDAAQVTAGRLHAAARGAEQRLRWRRTVMSIPSSSAGSSVPDSDSDLRPGASAGGGANRPCSRRLARTKYPPCPKPRTFTIVRRRLTNTYQRPLAGFSPRWVETSARGRNGSRQMGHVAL